MPFPVEGDQASSSCENICLSNFLEGLEIQKGDTPSKNSFGVKGTCTSKKRDSRSCDSIQKGTILGQLQFIYMVQGAPVSLAVPAPIWAGGVNSMKHVWCQVPKIENFIGVLLIERVCLPWVAMEWELSSR